MAMKLTINKVDNRLSRLREKPSVNAGLIKKWERIKRKIVDEEN